MRSFARFRLIILLVLLVITVRHVSISFSSFYFNVTLGSEEESESPLETAVRKVVSYKMTPKQALSIYNLTPKVQ